jgi:hypothetical protein
MKMKKDEAFLAVAKYRRDRKVEELRLQITHAQQEIGRITALEGDDLVRKFAMLRTTTIGSGDVHECGLGWLGDANAAAGMIADLTGEAVSFEFNGKVFAEYPRPKLT